MGEGTSREKPAKRICVGLLAHVDAGKTTLAERILYLTGSLRRLGRVDHQDAFLDTDDMERARGITIFSKEARFSLGDFDVALLDTPGHVDFSAEMERTLQVLDYAVLVISGADGVQGHVETLWRLLKRYGIPVFLFINKMDQEGTQEDLLMDQLKRRLDERCVRFCGGARGAQERGGPSGLSGKTAAASGENAAAAEGYESMSGGYEAGREEGGWRKTAPDGLWEDLAVCDEALLERYLEGEAISSGDIADLIARREVFPCCFGSALKGFGVTGLLSLMEECMREKRYPESFGARVYKISRDPSGARLTHLKVTGGRLCVKMPLTGRREGGGQAEGETWEEKADQLRLYSGDSFQAVPEVEAGTVCAVTGLSRTFAGQGLGLETEPVLPLLEPVLTYRIGLPEGCDVHDMYLKLRQLEEEEPELSILWEEAAGEIQARVMGDVQIEILKDQIRRRFGTAVSFENGSIVYRETIAAPVEGVGHFEPLRHYAEVHLLLEPAERGTGLSFASDCSADVLDENWQRLVLTHLEEKRHRGVLTGAEITDMKITLLTGRAHLKHTEGGDFRQATYRALRQGLRRAQSVLLEPVYSFTLEVPSQHVGRAMSDIQRMQGRFAPPELAGEYAVLTGTVPVSEMGNYQREVISYTRGRGRLQCTLKGYEPCHNAREVVEATGYDPDADPENPCGSVFCAHGAGFVVPWDQVEDYMHLERCYVPEDGREPGAEPQPEGLRPVSSQKGPAERIVTQEELEEIFARTYPSGNGKERRNGYARKRVETKASGPGQTAFGERRTPQKRQDPGERYLLVDGYNIIFAWESLRQLAAENIESARGQLMDILCDYQGFHSCTVILVFDAYRVEGGRGSVQKYHNIHVVFTREAETADQYIEKTVHKIGRGNQVTVATSDALEQVIIYGQGARRMSARELWDEVEQTREQVRETWGKKREEGRNYLFDGADAGLVRWADSMRLGKE
ncbi:MAG TPA: TetM/TetW/TetO/TetS family tetracycline resistance ribosomal protection protein [Candidatus Eisenbergiella merdigallinarum]|uniref:TetM/TetW/TetO/TetS family tetracycline resistance ribosomal protection protein n=1 Tax=Candidatus Eisenbergiella merdigallinarum TaxID=2838552 RepID=A0A9D2MSH0_9FIRM|nr:TetM/TetW/TetO/TetS family tetracycline resistance ribosomal protection protein [Candidatus Eisenbergiella merdigallinarum]